MLALSQLEEILDFYKCPCKAVGVREGGGFVDYILNLGKGATINKLQSRVNEISAALGQVVSIAFENLQIILRVKEDSQNVYNYFEYSNNLERKAGQLAIGINPRGEYVQYNLFDMPHLLVAGATGSGKSVFLHNAIISLGQNDNVCFTLIDLKKVELSIYNGLNKVDGEVVTDAARAEYVLRCEVHEMTARYELMERYGVRNYKQLPPEKALKARIIVIDELADLMLNRETRKSVENSIVRIAQLGRAAGCHLILATQRPSTNVITGLIKANIPCQLAFMTANPIDSRVIGCKGAENLSGRGDGLLNIAGHKELERVQAFYISDEDLQKFVDMVRTQQPPQPPTTPKIFGFIKRLFG
jgi:S-DNA-T family DNA segregation ATPase FtsK/SpoIIIE